MAHPLVERLRRIARTFEDCTAEERRFIANLAEEIDRLLGGIATENGERDRVPSGVTTLHGQFH